MCVLFLNLKLKNSGGKYFKKKSMMEYSAGTSHQINQHLPNLEEISDTQLKLSSSKDNFRRGNRMSSDAQ